MKNKLSWTAVLALMAALLSFPAPAAGSPAAALVASPAAVLAAEGEGNTTVGIRTAADGVPDDRGRFDYEILPRKSKQDGIAIYNYSQKPVTVRILARDATTTPAGEFTAQESADKPRDVGSWIALSKSQVTLKKRSMTVVPFQVGVPYNATPGDHTGSILVSLLAKEPKPGSDDVIVEHRVGLRVYLRVPGALTPELKIQNLKQSYQGTWTSLGFGRTEVSYTIRNSGNVRLTTEQQIEVLRAYGLSSKSARPEGLKELLPGAFARVQQEFPGSWAIGKVRAKVTLTPAGLDPSVSDVPLVVEETSVFVLPWLLLLILALVALAVVGFLRLRRPRQGGLNSDADLDETPGPAPSEPVMASSGGSHKHRLERGVLAGLASLVLIGLGTAFAPLAHAETNVPVWKATVIPKSGAADEPIELMTSGGCPAPADSILGRVYGKGFPKDGENVIGNTKAGVNPSGPFPAPLVYSMKEFMSDQERPVALEGVYRIVVNCRTAKFPKSYGDYVAEIKFTSPNKWVALKPVTNKSGPNLDAAGNPIKPGSRPATPAPGDPAAGLPSQAADGAQAGQDSASASAGGPQLTDSAESGGPGASGYGLIIGGGLIAVATLGFLWKRRTS